VGRGQVGQGARERRDILLFRGTAAAARYFVGSSERVAGHREWSRHGEWLPSSRCFDKSLVYDRLKALRKRDSEANIRFRCSDR